jgi:hypothetical protein
MSDATTGYLKRFGISLGTVCVFSGLVLLRGTINDAFVAPWFWTEMTLYWNPPTPPFQIHPIVYSVATLVILAITARRKWSSVVAATWFGFNAASVVWLFTVYDGKA